MIVVKTVGRDVQHAELRLELVLKMDGSPTPEALSGTGRLRFKILHATSEERALLGAHGIHLEDVDLRWAELHHRQPVKSIRRAGSGGRSGKSATPASDSPCPIDTPTPQTLRVVA